MSSSIRMMRVLGPAIAVWFGAGVALADPSFPEQLQKDWGVPCLPKCTVCHLTLQGGAGTLRPTTNGNSGFGANLKNLYDLNTSDLSSIHVALAHAKQDGTDVDGDGKTDFDELSKGDDPNDPSDGASICGGDSGPEFGCVRVAKRGPVDGQAAFAALAMLVTLGAFRRRRARR